MKVNPSYMTVENIIEAVNLPDDELGKLLLEFPIQRPAGQWNNEKKGRLIHAVLCGDPVPDLYIATSNGVEIAPQYLLDGVQRVTTMVEFCTQTDGKRAMRLWNKTPDVDIPVSVKGEDGKAYLSTMTVKLAGKTFKQLPKEAQRAILKFRFDVKLLSDYTDEDLARIMYNLNNGITATATQKAVMKLGMDAGKEIKKLTESDLFEEDFLFTSREEKRSEAHKCVLYSMLQWTGQEYEDFNYSKLTGSTLNTLIDKYSKTWTASHYEGIQSIFDTLHNLLPENEETWRPYFKATHLPVWVMNVDKYLGMLADGEITEEQYHQFLVLWFTKGVKSKEFVALAVDDSKNISAKSNIEARIDLMDAALDTYIQTGNLGLTTDRLTAFSSCVESIVDTLGADTLTAARAILSTTQDVYFFEYDDCVKYFTELMTETETDEAIRRADTVTHALQSDNLCDEELPSYYALYRIIEEEGLSTKYFADWLELKGLLFNHETYLGLLGSYDGTAEAQTAITDYLKTKFTEYLDQATAELATAEVLQPA